VADHSPHIRPGDVSVEITNLNVRFGDARVLVDVNAALQCRGVTALVGPNGAGKSTLIAAILGQAPYSGTIDFCRHTRHGRARHRIGLVPQQIAFDRDAPVTVLDFLCLAEQRRPLWLGRRRALIEQAMRALEYTHATNLAHKTLGALSGGELKRALVAAALRQEPDLLLLDEPGAGLDVAGEELFCELLDQLSDEPDLTVLWVSHDLSAVQKHAQHVIALNKSVLFEGPPAQVLTPERVTALYGLMAIGAEPAHCRDCEAGAEHEHLGGKP
jgi:zinc transport system ATP-binding protein